MGQKFIDLCDPLGEKSILKKIKNEFGDFASLRSIKCFPNLSSQKFIKDYMFMTYYDFINAYNNNNSQFKNEMYIRMDLLNEVFVNECYLENFHRYRFE